MLFSFHISEIGEHLVLGVKDLVFTPWTIHLILCFSDVPFLIQVRVQSDPAGRLVISGDPEQPDNPWGVTSFKKVCYYIFLLV